MYFDETADVWRYTDTDEPLPENPTRRCGHCNLPNRPDGHDACLGVLPGVMNACCGHGDPAAFYVQTEVDEFREAVRHLVHHIWMRLVPMVEPLVAWLARAGR